MKTSWLKSPGSFCAQESLRILLLMGVWTDTDVVAIVTAVLSYAFFPPELNILYEEIRFLEICYMFFIESESVSEC